MPWSLNKTSDNERLPESDNETPPQSAGAKDNEAAMEMLGNLGTALQVGTLTGMGGLLAGAVGGILTTTTTPTLFAVTSGIQWFSLGATYTAARKVAMQLPSPTDTTQPISPILASAISGATAGGVGGALRSRRNILPGMVFFGLAGAVGQKVYDSRQVVTKEEADQNLKTSWMNAKWSPVKVLSDDEYESLLREKMLRVSADIAILDESIEAVRKEAAEQPLKPMEAPVPVVEERKKS